MKMDTLRSKGIGMPDNFELFRCTDPYSKTAMDDHSSFTGKTWNIVLVMWTIMRMFSTFQWPFKPFQLLRTKLVPSQTYNMMLRLWTHENGQNCPSILFCKYLLNMNEHTLLWCTFTNSGVTKSVIILNARILRFFLEPESNMPPSSPLPFEDGKALREGHGS